MMTTIPHIKNLYSEPLDNVFRDLRICTKPMETCGLTCSSNMLAVPWEVGGGGVIGAIRLIDTMRNPPVMKLKGHTAAILDLSFNPTYDSVIASCSEDLTIRVWDMLQLENFNDWDLMEDLKRESNYTNEDKENSTGRNNMFNNAVNTGREMDKNLELKECLCILKGHKKKVTYINWNARSPHILASTGFDSQINIWDIENEKKAFQLSAPKKLTALKWNIQGSLLCGVCINKNIHIIDPRMKTISNSFNVHNGGRMAKCIWFDGLSGNDDYVLSTGFSKESMREVKLWDLKKPNEPIDFKVLDNSAAPLFPFYDETIGVVYLIGKGDGNCRYYQYFQGALQKVNEYKSNSPFKSFGMMPKKTCDITKCELGRVYKNENNNSIRPISFCVPRKNVCVFQEDLYPPLITEDYNNEASDWVEGRDKEIKRVSINELTEQHLKPSKLFKDASCMDRGSIIIQDLDEANDRKNIMRQITKTFNYFKRNTQYLNNISHEKQHEKHGLDNSSDDMDDEAYATLKKEMEFYRDEANRNKQLVTALQQQIAELEKEIKNKENGIQSERKKHRRSDEVDNSSNNAQEVIHEQQMTQPNTHQQGYLDMNRENDKEKYKNDFNDAMTFDTQEYELEKSTKQSSSEDKNLREKKRMGKKFNNFVNNMKNIKLFHKKN